MTPYMEMKLMAEAAESNRLEVQTKLDRVTAERDAALETVALKNRDALEAQTAVTGWARKYDALQQRLTAADERADALGSLVPEAELALKALNVAVSVYDVELADRARRGLRLIIVSLKPADGGVDEA